MIVDLARAGSFAEVPTNSVTEDDIYAGLFEESDGTFCRCELIQRTDDGYKVILIDYGNEVVTRDLRILPAKIKAIAPLAIHCCLEPKADAWNTEQLKTFTHLTSTQNIFCAEIIDASRSPQVIRLFHADTNVLDMCQPANALDSTQQNKKCSGVVVKDGKFVCSCRKSFCRLQHLERHQRPESEFTCEFCRKIIRRADNFKSHLKTHDETQYKHVSSAFQICFASPTFSCVPPKQSES